MTDTNTKLIKTFLGKLRIKAAANKAIYSLMFIGLDNGGKSSLIDYISKQLAQVNNPSRQPQSSMRTQSDQSKLRPTIGYNYQQVIYNDNVTLNILDFSGNSRYRDLWQEFFCAVDGIVFVVDLADPIRFVVARDELITLVNHPYFNSLENRTYISVDQNSMTPEMIRPIEIQKVLTINNNKLVESPLDTSPQVGLLGTGQNQVGKRRKPRSQVPILIMANKCDSSNSTDPNLLKMALNLDKLNKIRHPCHVQPTSSMTGQGIKDGINWLLDRLN